MYGSKNVIDEDAYQITQAKIAIAQVALSVQGRATVHNENFLPQAYNDFIFPIIIEEYGLWAGCSFYLLYRFSIPVYTDI
jgi:cell division protein FtsW